MNYRCLIIDQHIGEAGVLAEQLKANKDISVIGFAENEGSIKKRLREIKPNLVFIDPDWIQNDLEALLDAMELVLSKYLIIIISKKETTRPYLKENIIDYLQKPFDKQRIENTLKKLTNIKSIFSQDIDFKNNGASFQPSNLQKLAVNNGDHINFIDLIDICYFKADHKYTAAHTFDQFHLINKSLTYLEDQLPDIFVRIHKSYLVNLLKINIMMNNGSGKYSAVIADKLKSEIPISRSGKSKLNKYLIS